MTKRPGIHQIAELANVSIGTVDRALHERPGINDATRQRVLRIAQELRYQPNRAARALSGRRAKIRVGVCMPREIRFFYDQLWDGIYEEARRYADFGIEFLYSPVQELGEGETRELKKILASGVQGVILTPGNPVETAPLIDHAEEEDVRVICISTDAPTSKRSSVICVEPRLNGMLAGELLAKFVSPGSRVAIITGMLRTEDHSRKVQGFTSSFPQYCRDGTIVEVIEGHEDEDESFQKTFELLGRIPDLAGIYVNTVNCVPVCRALGARKLAGKIRVITTDLFLEMVPYFEKGTICASIYQRPYQQGRLAVTTLVEHLMSNAPLHPTNYLNPSIVLGSNLHLFREIRLAKQSPVAAQILA